MVGAQRQCRVSLIGRSQWRDHYSVLWEDGKSYSVIFDRADKSFNCDCLLCSNEFNEKDCRNVKAVRPEVEKLLEKDRYERKRQVDSKKRA